MKNSSLCISLLLLVGSCASTSIEYPGDFVFGNKVTPHIIEYTLNVPNVRVVIADRARRTETPYLNRPELKRVILVNANTGVYAKFEIGEGADKVAEYQVSGPSTKPASDGFISAFLSQDLAAKHIEQRKIAGEVCEVWQSDRRGKECITKDGIVLWSEGGPVGTQFKIATKLTRGDPAPEEFLPPKDYDLIDSRLCRGPIVKKSFGESVTVPAECAPLLKHMDWFQ